MLINIRLLNGRVLQVDTEPTDKISDLKAKLEEVEGITPEQQRLVFGGRQLADDKTLQELNVQPGTTFNLLLALRGGF
ncbi:Ubiquitin-like [Entamoeba marina]